MVSAWFSACRLHHSASPCQTRMCVQALQAVLSTQMRTQASFGFQHRSAPVPWPVTPLPRHFHAALQQPGGGAGLHCTALLAFRAQQAARRVSNRRSKAVHAAPASCPHPRPDTWQPEKLRCLPVRPGAAGSRAFQAKQASKTRCQGFGCPRAGAQAGWAQLAEQTHRVHPPVSSSPSALDVACPVQDVRVDARVTLCLVKNSSGLHRRTVFRLL